MKLSKGAKYLNVGDYAKVRKNGEEYLILKFMTKIDGEYLALLKWSENDECWWPVDELIKVEMKQEELF